MQRAVTVAAVMTLLASPLGAQATPASLGIQGTAVYSVNWIRSSPDGRGWQAGVGRFGGRAAAHVVGGLYAGAGVSSWQLAVPVVGSEAQPGSHYSTVATSVIIAGYGQFYPFHQRSVFARAGAGFASSHRFYQVFSSVQNDSVIGELGDSPALHPALTAGAGLDLPIRSHLAFTLSADYTTLRGGSPIYGEVRSAMLAGFGLTIR